MKRLMSFFLVIMSLKGAAMQMSEDDLKDLLAKDYLDKNDLTSIEQIINTSTDKLKLLKDDNNFGELLSKSVVGDRELREFIERLLSQFSADEKFDFLSHQSKVSTKVKEIKSEITLCNFAHIIQTTTILRSDNGLQVLLSGIDNLHKKQLIMHSMHSPDKAYYPLLRYTLDQRKFVAGHEWSERLKIFLAGIEGWDRVEVLLSKQGDSLLGSAVLSNLAFLTKKYSFYEMLRLVEILIKTISGQDRISFLSSEFFMDFLVAFKEDCTSFIGKGLSIKINKTEVVHLYQKLLEIFLDGMTEQDKNRLVDNLYQLYPDKMNDMFKDEILNPRAGLKRLQAALVLLKSKLLVLAEKLKELTQSLVSG